MCNWDHTYRTLDTAYIQQILRSFHALYERGLVFRDWLPVHWSPTNRTALAEAELVYNDQHVSRACFLRISLVGASVLHPSLSDEVNALVWTTTAWTLPSNRAIAFNPELEYSVVRCASSGRLYLIGSTEKSR